MYTESKNGTKKLTTYQLTLTAVMAAVICVLGPISMAIPISPVPISLASMAVYLAVTVLGMKLGTLSCLIYLLLGLVGLPVFSGGSAGAAKLFGPTGGYLVGYLFLALIAGAFVGRYTENKWKSIAFAALGMVLGTMVLYALGTAWLAYSAGMDFQAALWAGVIPFIPGDLVKMVIAVLLGSAVRGRLLRAGILEGNN
ncbi:biotin transporter BioY [Laedolimicola ammoniilytica]|uniref:Biotin transporter n=1 Tax=Laedolimicola ammoniilytica TaxID=2981771 RepID=A0ABT2RX46_9FIRM|nr:biotin transporter BioY [Laedolimicola ammoniilytica]MCC2826614.1 biotin transporter BioY [Faecalicatena orotica]MCU6696890.1 biotin transporter BioY [Laedolimicola ammoniilytica]SCH45005.1 Biotin ECF transporter S component BioY [uncultured Clostridium sp.]SCH97766.1 Biotin ECF transporter S component BioY [uncultured Clostridium sp.]